MMFHKALKFVFLNLLLLSFSAEGGHLVGGEISYKCLGNNDYEFTMIIYRDCIAQGPNVAQDFDKPANITVLDQFNNIVINTGVPILNQQQLPLVAPNNCTSLPNNLCTEKGVYQFVLKLPPIQGGYTITHQRCCRNRTISNINNGTSDWGSTFTTSIPSMDNCNSSPKFDADPPVVLCINQDVSLDLGATDDDGDSLYYELCSVLHGGSNPSNIVPNPASPPPYTNVPFIGGFSTTYPIASNPAFSVDPNTGLLQGKPTQVGQFVFAVCVSEYRNGTKLSTTRRDFQFNVSSACQAIISGIQAQHLTPSNMCSGGPISFTNISTRANSFWWDFGDTTTLADTSRGKNPTYTYPDTGTYYVTLVAAPYSDCADTTTAEFKVFEAIDVEFSQQGDYCAKTNSVNFTARGDYSENANFQWDFGGATGPADATSASPQGVSWDVPGIYYVELQVSDFGCDAVYGDTVKITENPIIQESVPALSECAPYTVQFTDHTEAFGRVQHFWFFGDGNVSYEPSPTHTYMRPGTYTVQHAIKTTEGCLDSGYASYENIITILPVPQSGLELDTREQSIYNPKFTIENKSNAYSHTETVLPGGEIIQNLTERVFNVKDSGKYEIIHISYNEHGCTDTVVDSVRVTTPFNLYVPNAFTPNGDGINDHFSFTATDVRSVRLEIYSRWGELVFSSSDMDAKWNGRLNNTEEVLPGGAYAYVIIADVKDGGHQFTKRGIIHLIR